MKPIRKASVQDASRLAEILIFAKRVHYRRIFCNDKVSFGEMQVLPLAQEYLADTEKLESVWVYDDEFVKGMIHTGQNEIQELYVDPFFQNMGIGTQLITFAIQEQGARWLWVLEKNEQAIRFYQSHGFRMTKERRTEAGTAEFVVKMQRDMPGSRPCLVNKHTVQG
ncbi:MAG: GNAT family N-acetyltransferase [Lachnospiraceae bacterium]|jgi:ribosomal protein S18 acetylase RimI-like enzyme|nr:GNAT family N-acetyltransferase [Lachnospiraceae bacterium]